MVKNKRIRRLKNKRKAKEITKTILSLCAVGVLTLLAGSGVRNPDKARKLIEGLGEYSFSRIKECLKRLKMQDYIRYDENDLNKPIIITKKGLGRHAICTLKDKISGMMMKKWDHIWRLVTFDVEEKNRWKRDSFRRHLRRMNFFRLQKNIYIIPFAIEKEIEQFVKSCGMWNQALILHVADLGKREKEAREYFLNSKKK